MSLKDTIWNESHLVVTRHPLKRGQMCISWMTKLCKLVETLYVKSPRLNSAKSSGMNMAKSRFVRQNLWAFRCSCNQMKVQPWAACAGFRGLGGRLSSELWKDIGSQAETRAAAAARGIGPKQVAIKILAIVTTFIIMLMARLLIWMTVMEGEGHGRKSSKALHWKSLWRPFFSSSPHFLSRGLEVNMFMASNNQGQPRPTAEAASHKTMLLFYCHYTFYIRFHLVLPFWLSCISFFLLF